MRDIDFGLDFDDLSGDDDVAAFREQLMRSPLTKLELLRLSDSLMHDALVARERGDRDSARRLNAASLQSWLLAS